MDPSRRPYGTTGSVVAGLVADVAIRRGGMVPPLDRGLRREVSEPHATQEPVMKDSTTYVALDTHKKEHAVALLLPGVDDPEVWTIPNTKRDVRRMVRRILARAPGRVMFCYEAGVCGFALQRQIEAAGAACEVIAPSLVPVQAGKRIKTDRRDARNLAKMFRAGMLTEVHPPTEEEESIRDLCRCREAAQRDLMRIRHQLSKFLFRRGWIYQAGTQWTQKHLDWIARIRFDRARDQWMLSAYSLELEHRQERVRSLTRAVEEAAANSPWREQIGWLRCFRGIDTLTAVTILSELHGVGRFDSPRQLMSYLGLTPSEDSSGDKDRKGSITKAGNRRVRRVLVEASWHQARAPRVSAALRKRREGQPAWVIEVADRAMKRLHDRYWRLVHRGKLPTTAATAVSRELCGFLWAVLHLKERSVRRRAIPRRRDPAAASEQAPAPKRMTAREFLTAKDLEAVEAR
jgi:transposase